MPQPYEPMPAPLFFSSSKICNNGGSAAKQGWASLYCTSMATSPALSQDPHVGEEVAHRSWPSGTILGPEGGGGGGLVWLSRVARAQCSWQLGRDTCNRCLCKRQTRERVESWTPSRFGSPTTKGSRCAAAKGASHKGSPLSHSEDPAPAHPELIGNQLRPPNGPF